MEHSTKLRVETISKNMALVSDMVHEVTKQYGMTSCSHIVNRIDLYELTIGVIAESPDMLVDTKLEHSEVLKLVNRHVANALDKYNKRQEARRY